MSGRAGKVRKKRVSRSARAGVVFPVSRIYRYLKVLLLKKRIAIGAPVYLSAVLEYLCAEVLELAGNAARDNKRRTITPRHVLLAIANDDELHKLLKGVTISQGGVLPHIKEELLYTKNKLKVISKAMSTPSAKQADKAESPPTSSKKATKPSKAPAPQKQQRSSKAVSTTVASGITVLSEKTLVQGQKLTVIQGNIAEMTVDAVVHPTNSSFSLSGQCGTALQAAGGASFEQEVSDLAKKSSIPVAEAAISGAGDQLPCRHVIHVHSPSWTATDGVANLEKAVKSCLTLAENTGLKTVAFPSIASGQNNFPKQTAAQTILQSIRDYFASTPTSQLTQIYFNLYDTESVNIYTSELGKLQD
ncbi:hypothetical protein EMCRGX_G006496 [Ephydatia muelleri]